MADLLTTGKKETQAPGKFIFGLNLPQTLRLTMFGTLIVLANSALRIPLHTPGHTSIWWMGILVTGKGLIKRPGAGTVMGLVSGILAVVLGLGSEGALVFFKFLLPGLLIDFLAAFFAYRLELPVIAAICGALASLSKMMVNFLLGMLLKIPMVFLTMGMGFTSVAHALFGATGGVLAAVIIKRLKPRINNWE